MSSAEITKIQKRYGSVVTFELEKIKEAIRKALIATNTGNGKIAEKLAKQFLTTDGLSKISLAECDKRCVLNKEVGSSVGIQTVINYITAKQ